MAKKSGTAKMDPLAEAVKRLNGEQSESNWKSLASTLKKSGIKYYKVGYAASLDGESDLTKAHVKLYDKKHSEVYTIPLIVMDGKRIEGATRFLIGLEINRRVL
jgi:RNase H-fold protein (predicted Holliday junction resolvase)